MVSKKDLNKARFMLLNAKPPDGFTCSWRELTRKQTTSRPDNVWPDMWKLMSDASKRKDKQKWAIEKPKLDNARRLRGVFFIEPDDEEFKRTMKKRSWKVGNSDASSNDLQNTNKLPRWSLQQYGETQDPICLYCRCRRIYEETYGRVSEQEPWRPHHRRRHEFIESLQSCALPQVMKISDAKAAVEK